MQAFKVEVRMRILSCFSLDGWNEIKVTQTFKQTDSSDESMRICCGLKLVHF
jgi:hypothetical protein